MYKKFASLLLQWHLKENKRTMPWKGEKDPYKVWLSEVILQQTRVEQGWTYYEKFVAQYPSVETLAAAKDEEVFKLWEGLGYYTRCKNLLHTARFIATHYNGKFPATYKEIVALKGVGTYTASAITSFCFNLPYAAVDGNVLRVLARVFGNATSIDSTNGKIFFSELAYKVLDKSNAGLFNQAIMDFGATVCKPVLPVCSQCCLRYDCIAFKKGTINALPVKEKVLKKKTRWFSYFIFEANNKILIQKRRTKDIWQNLFEFYLVETEANPAWTNETVASFVENQLGVDEFSIEYIVPAKSQQLTHRHIKGYFVSISFNEIPEKLKGGGNKWVEPKYMARLAFPGFINQNLRDIKNEASSF